MVRLPSEHRLGALAVAHHDVGPCIEQLARDMARFHEAAPTGGAIDAAATRDAVAALWELGIAQTGPYEGTILPAATARCVASLAREYLRGRESLFDARIDAHRARDGHGDLLAEDVFCLDDGPRAIDCLEFDDQLRYGDVLADVAFLGMDLERLGRTDLSRRFLDRYREASADVWPASLVDLYIAYRAHVRAKVACLRHSQGDERAAEEASALLHLAHSHLEAGRVRVVLVGGPPASGKSTLAMAIGHELDWPVLRSDVVRKEIAGLAPSAHAAAALDEGIYAPQLSERTYTTLVDRARLHTSFGESVVLDASWSQPQFRAMADALARSTSSELVAFRCDAPADVRTARAAERAARGTDESDAGPELATVLGARFADWPHATTVDTTRSQRAVTDAVITALRRPSCATAPRAS